jgi:nucleoside-diphosphate-sugar epimerase
MIIGNGFLARAFHEFKNEEDILIYTSGVSNSNETRISEYLREKELLTHTIESFPDKKIIYFSTISIFDPSLNESLYIKHKREMEYYLTKTNKNILILRLPNIVGFSDNPHTLTNYIYYQIKNDFSFNVYSNAYRYLMDIEDVVKLCCYIIRRRINKNIFNISFCEPISSTDLVKHFENVLNKKAIYTIQAKGSFYNVPEDIAELPLADVGISFTKNYYADLIQKYYSKI